MESFLTFYPGKELRAALVQRELEGCVVQWDGTRRHGTTPNFAPELRLRSQVLAVSSNFAGLDRKTPQRPPHVEHAVTRSVTGCRLTSQRHECSVPCRSGASLASLPLGQVPRTCRSPLHAPGHNRSFPTRSQVRSRSTHERQVSGGDSEAFVGSTRPIAGACASQSYDRLSLIAPVRHPARHLRRRFATWRMISAKWQESPHEAV